MNVVLTIAGSDSSGGAGIQADLKTFEAFGVFGTSAITVLTAQNTQGVTAIQTLPIDFIREQIEVVMKDFNVSAIKIGMLFSNDIIDLVRETIKDLSIPIVFDPVFISKAGSKLLDDSAIENMKSLLPYVTVSTPNIYEATNLFNYNDTTHTMNEPSSAIVVKNHLVNKNGTTKSIDTLFYQAEETSFHSDYIETDNTHGTGCSFSSAIAANLAQGKTLEDAIQIAKSFIYEGIKHAPNLGHGKGPISHKIGGELCRLT